MLHCRLPTNFLPPSKIVQPAHAISTAINPGQAFAEIVRHELISLMGSDHTALKLKEKPRHYSWLRTTRRWQNHQSGEDCQTSQDPQQKTRCCWHRRYLSSRRPPTTFYFSRFYRNSMHQQRTNHRCCRQSERDYHRRPQTTCRCRHH